MQVTDIIGKTFADRVAESEYLPFASRMHRCVSLGLDRKVRNVYYYISLEETCVVR